MASSEAPLRVLAVVDDAPELGAALESRGIDVVTGGRGEALATIDDPIHCVVIGENLPEFDAIEHCGAIRERDESRPIVLALDGPLADRGEAAIEAGVSATGRLGAVEELAETVSDAAANYRDSIEERTQRQTDARVLDALLSNLPLSIYVKDEEHRHVRVSDGMICGPDADEFIQNDEGKNPPASQRPARKDGLRHPRPRQRIRDRRR